MLISIGGFIWIYNRKKVSPLFGTPIEEEKYDLENPESLWKTFRNYYRGSRVPALFALTMGFYKLIILIELAKIIAQVIIVPYYHQALQIICIVALFVPGVLFIVHTPFGKNRRNPVIMILLKLLGLSEIYT